MTLPGISQIIASFESRANKANLSSNVDNHVNSYSLWSSKASLATTSTESSKYFGAAGSEAQDGLNDASNIAAAVYDLEKAAFELMNMTFTENIQNLIGEAGIQPAKLAAEKEAAKGNVMAAHMLDKIESGEQKKVSNVEELQNYAQKKANEAYEMKGNMAIFYDQTVMMFGGLKSFADEKVYVSSQTTDTRSARFNDKNQLDMNGPDVKLSNIEPDKDDEDKNNAGKDKKADSQNNKSNQSKAGNNPVSNNNSNTSAIQSFTGNYSAPNLAVRPIVMA